MPGVGVEPVFAVCALLPAEECYIQLSSFSLILGADQGSREKVTLQAEHQSAGWVQHVQTAPSGGATHDHDDQKHFPAFVAG